MCSLLIADGIEPIDTDSDGRLEVSTLDHLLWISTNLSGWGFTYEQTADINVSESVYWDDSDDNNDGNLYNDPNDITINGTNDGFSPIGEKPTNAFTGEYHG